MKKNERYLIELKGLSEKSLTEPLDDKDYKRMMFLRDKLNIIGGKIPKV